MTTNPVYDLLLKDITDEMERKLLDVLLAQAGERISRIDLVEAVHGLDARLLAEKVGIGNSTHDRQNRELIERLQGRDYPIVSSSGAGGYTLAADAQTTESYIAEIGSRIQQMTAKRDALNRSKRWIPFIQEWMAGRPAVQAPLFKM
jgi:hypothetical protein